MRSLFRIRINFILLAVLQLAQTVLNRLKVLDYFTVVVFDLATDVSKTGKHKRGYQRYRNDIQHVHLLNLGQVVSILVEQVEEFVTPVHRLAILGILLRN